MSDDQVPEQEALRAEIEKTRTELGETVEALAAKTHVTARAGRAADRLAGSVRSAVARWRIWRWRRS